MQSSERKAGHAAAQEDRGGATHLANCFLPHSLQGVWPTAVRGAEHHREPQLTAAVNRSFGVNQIQALEDRSHAGLVPPKGCGLRAVGEICPLSEAGSRICVSMSHGV